MRGGLCVDISHKNNELIDYTLVTNGKPTPEHVFRVGFVILASIFLRVDPIDRATRQNAKLLGHKPL